MSKKFLSIKSSIYKIASYFYMKNIIKINENTINKIVSDSIKKILIEGLTKSYSYYCFCDYLKNLGFKRIMTSRDYDGNPIETIKHLRIDKDLYTDDIKNKFNSILNIFGWQIIKTNTGKRTDCSSGDEIPTIFFDIEAKYGNGYIADGIYYHASPKNKISKILRNGLCPRDEGKRGDYRGPRIYLAAHNDDFIFNSVLGDTDYKVLEVDLRGSGIMVYKDEYAQNSVYTLQNIPPNRIKITTNIANVKEEKTKEFLVAIDELAKKYNLNLNGYTIRGNVCGIQIEIHFEAFPYVSHNGRNFEFWIHKKNGNRSYTSDVVGFNTKEEVVAYVEKEIKKIIKRNEKGKK